MLHNHRRPLAVRLALALLLDAYLTARRIVHGK